MRDNQPKMSEAAAASLRSGELETGRGWRMLDSGRMVTSFLALTIMFQFLLVSAPCALCCANLGPPAAWRRAVAEIFIFHFSLSCSPGRRAADGDTAASRGEVTRTNSNIISLRPVVASGLGGHQAGAAATDRVQTTAASVWTLRGAPLSSAASTARPLCALAVPRCLGSCGATVAPPPSGPTADAAPCPATAAWSPTHSSSIFIVSEA